MLLIMTGFRGLLVSPINNFTLSSCQLKFFFFIFRPLQIQPGVHYASHSDMSRPDPSALQNVVVNAHWLVTLQKQALLPSK